MRRSGKGRQPFAQSGIHLRGRGRSPLWSAKSPAPAPLSELTFFSFGAQQRPRGECDGRVGTVVLWGRDEEGWLQLTYATSSPIGEGEATDLICGPGMCPLPRPYLNNWVEVRIPQLGGWEWIPAPWDYGRKREGSPKLFLPHWDGCGFPLQGVGNLVGSSKVGLCGFG